MNLNAEEQILIKDIFNVTVDHNKYFSILNKVLEEPSY